MNAEAYRQVVDDLLAGLGLDPVETIEVLVKPFEATAKVVVRDDSGTKHKQHGKLVTKQVTIKRDDAP